MKLREILKRKIRKDLISKVPSSFDVTGSIAVFSDFPEELKDYEKKIGEALIKSRKDIQTVAIKTKNYSGVYRTRKIKIIAGEKTKETIHKENNCFFKLNIESCYFSPRSSEERKRIASLVKKDERVLVMFSGVAPFPIIISKNSKAKEIVAIEINPSCHKYAKLNIKKNKVNNVILIKGDVNKVEIKGKFDRIIMPLPKSSEDFLETAKKFSKKGTKIHFYKFAHENEMDLPKKIVSKVFKKIKKVKLIKCGKYSPGKFRTCLDFEVE